MIETFKRIAQIPELKLKITMTILLLIVCRIGGFVPVPGINSEVAAAYFKYESGGAQNLFQLMDMFSGGAFVQMSVTALGVMPYISASIIMQLMMAILPGLQREIRENQEQGRRKLIKWTRFLTVALSLFQSGLFAKSAIYMNTSRPGIIVGDLLDVTAFGMPILFYIIMMATMTTGTVFLMWIGEQITERGIGNGMSLIIAIGIVSSLPSAVGVILSQLNLDSQEPGQLAFAELLVFAFVFVTVIVATILIIQGQRRIPLQYARRVVGRREMQGGGSSYIPLKVNYAGVIPVIFATSILMFPATIGQFVSSGSTLGNVLSFLIPGSAFYYVFFVSLIIFFTYFWTATQFHPEQIASDMKKNGAFIPGIKQGKPTQDYLDSTMNRITLLGALFLAGIAIFPSLLGKFMGVDQRITYFFGGTPLLILVGVALDTMKQIESHLLMKRYDGFMKTGRVRGR
ncbi:Protein translocase subunit SecY [Chlamydiales bacterium SCGC AG-110-M15]|nr:Protein translocase subunit SecY [Chlamydiales bacterium SCGC AG-110-M15]